MQAFDCDGAWGCGDRSRRASLVLPTTHFDNEAQAWRATGAAARTYIWLASQGQEPLNDTADSNDGLDSNQPLFDAWPYSSSVPTSPTTLSPSPRIRLKMPHGLSLCDGRKSASPRSVLVKKTSRLRHAVSCVSLPRSPRQPHTLFQGSQTALQESKSSTPLLSASDRSRMMLAAPSRRPRGRSSSNKRPLPLNFSDSPLIVFTPSSAETPGKILFSPLSPSFQTDYPSESESSNYDFFKEDFGSSTESDSAWSKGTKNSSQSQNVLPPMCVRTLQVFRETYPEERNAPQLFAPKNAFKYVTDFFTAREVLTIDSSEFVHRSTILEPGMHGYVSPSVSALAGHLALFAKYNPGGCHIFLSRHTLNRKDFEYQYQGFYRVVQKDLRPFTDEKSQTTRMDTASECSEDNQLVFFLQFLGYDREVFNAIDRFALNEAQSPRKESSRSHSCSKALRKTPTWQAEDRGRSMMTTVDGVDFEIMPTNVAWNHGYLKDDSWICV